MPDYFSHYICAGKIYEKLGAAQKNKIKSRTLYLLGAQGGDVFFAYNLKLSKSNLGRVLHRLGAREIFSVLKDADPSYAAGFATHYALDCTIHPAVYAYEAKSSSPMAHHRFEADLGLYISKLYGERRRILPRDEVLSCTAKVYDAVKPLEETLTVTGVERCLKRHFSFSRYVFNNKRQTYRCDFDFPSLEGAVEDAVSLGANCVKAVLDGDDLSIFNREFLQK